LEPPAYRSGYDPGVFGSISVARQARREGAKAIKSGETDRSFLTGKIQKLIAMTALPAPHVVKTPEQLKKEKDWEDAKANGHFYWTKCLIGPALNHDMPIKFIFYEYDGQQNPIGCTGNKSYCDIGMYSHAFFIYNH